MADPEFRRDLYRGAAADYDRFRVPYPQALIDDLLARAGVRGGGRLLDLACGTGQIAFAMRHAFAEVWAVDQEPDMVAFVRGKAAVAGNIRCLAAAAEDAALPDGAFELVAIGNAFHRLRRDEVAARAMRWLRPGGHLALLWSNGPQAGDAPWQSALTAVFRRWTPPGRVPADWDAPRCARPDVDVLRAAGFAAVGGFRFPTAYRWSVERLIGYAHSMSGLSRAALGDDVGRFERDVADALRGHDLVATMDFAYELARKPAPSGQ